MCDVMVAGGMATLLIWLTLPGVLPACEFPDFLRRPLPGGGQRYWLTETRFRQTSPEWERRLQITVHKHQVVAKVAQEGMCNKGSGRVACTRTELKYTLTCEEEKDGKFKVRKHQNGEPSYICYDFKKRNNNVVQVWKSKTLASTEFLCRGFTMVRDEWLWVAPHLEEWVPCPLQGGYDFITYDVHEHHQYEEPYCEDSPIPSRFESECIKGDGFQFIFPTAACSPFPGKKQNVQLYCWAYWTEEDKTFVVLSEANSTPQFVLRYNSQLSRPTQTTSYFYFSPVIPLSTTGGLSDGVTDNIFIVKMLITPSDPGDGLCYDEATTCNDDTYETQCDNTDIMQSSYCKRTCGLCKFLPNSQTECNFQDLQGSWLYFIQGEPETVTIDQGYIRFSSLGQFICKSVQSPQRVFVRQYKVFSYYNNGCRPRYSCIELGPNANTEDVNQFRLSPSEPKDEGFDMCKFREDPSPINGAIRSYRKKNLLPMSMTEFNSCSLHGEVPVSKDHTNDKCYGQLSDWNREICELDDVLRLNINGACDQYGGYSSVYRELTCLAFSSLRGYSLLFTREIARNNQFTCWIVETYGESMSYRPWRFMHQLNTTDCNSVDFTSMPTGHNLIDLNIMGGIRKQICDSSPDTGIKYERSDASNEDRKPPISAGDPSLKTDCETNTRQPREETRTPDRESPHSSGAVSSANTVCSLHHLACTFTLILCVYHLYLIKLR